MTPEWKAWTIYWTTWLLCIAFLGGMIVLLAGFVKADPSIADGVELGSCVMEQMLDAEPWELRELPTVLMVLEEGKKSYRAAFRNSSGRGFYNYGSDHILPKHGAVSFRVSFLSTTSTIALPPGRDGRRRIVYLPVSCDHRTDEVERFAR